MTDERRDCILLAMRLVLPAFLAFGLVLSGCSRDAGNPAPPRVDTPLPVPELTSTIAVPVTASLDELARRLEAQIPRTVWTIDEVRPNCIPAQRVSIGVLGIENAKITPDIACLIKGDAVRGRLRLKGAGETLRLTMPITATVNVRDARGRLAGETATAKAMVKARIRLAVTPDWQAKASVGLDYDWLQPPSFELLGASISLKSPADKALAALVPRLEADIPKLIAAIHTREALADAWESAFTTIELNHENPQVWLRVAPEALHVGRWQVNGRTITLPITVRAAASTIIGHRPADPEPTTLPPPDAPIGDSLVNISLPVIADYAVLEPVLAKALGKLSAKGIEIPDIGRVNVQFGRVTLYPTTGERIAVGLEIDAKSPRQFLQARGTLWLAGTPITTPGSQIVRIADLAVVSRTDSRGFDLLVAIADDPDIKAAIADALTQDFSKDLDKLMAKISPKLAALPIGKNFMLKAEITQFRNGTVSPLGQGLFMPVTAQAHAVLSYRPGSGQAMRAAAKSDRAIAGNASDRPLKTPVGRL